MNLSDLILFEDEAILVINKPAGLTVHPDGKKDFNTLTDLVLQDRPEMKTVGEPLKLDDGDYVLRPGIVHRLDRDTSGIMILAKTPDAYQNLKEQFQNHEVKKNYRAIVVGSFRSVRGVIKEPIGRSNLDIRKWAAGVHARGEKREALTRYSVRASGKVADTEGTEQTLSYLDIYPETGRTHQIRVHLQYIQHPIIGDNLYASYAPKFLGAERQMLHSHMITFKHPVTGKKISYIADLPNDMEKIIKKLDEK